ncbi:MAG: 5-methylthioadenosine/S-adenosylhomocysteine deaminase [Candidatus Argoarchaeum ethanivorans]|uniref:5-methylthioadenosine/S-adenosylhomocysteine deaminase n=1 Tax=Candidatus Argoarchaeum ethanivorans TaxID=2608793 RepID=A0A8B3S1G6_9EURY|nr:MAG: 5-methylthioadenosine/S-adenosylhomocysteine deaminase [Candidatus Argoarchaeum ethanivorans]
MSEFVITGGYVLAPDMKLKRADVAVGSGIITQVGECQSAEQTIDAKNCIVMPGLINAHTHTPMTLLRGACENLMFEQWQKCIWNKEAKITPSDVHLGSLLACVEMIKTGTTSFADVYIHMDRAASAIKKSGLRGVLGWGVIEGFGEPLREKLAHRRAFVRQYNNAADGRITTMYAPHSPSTCSMEALGLLSRMSEEDNVLVTTHLLETRKEAETLKKDNCHLQCLKDAGLLSGRLLAAHSVWANDEDIKILSQHGVSVAHNPISNMKLSVGTAPVTAMLREHVNVCLGTDGAAPGGSLDMFASMRTAALLRRDRGQDTHLQDILKMATVNGAAALGLLAGQIKKGFLADIILVDMKKPHLTGHDPLSALVYSATGADVKTSMVGGEVLMEDYQIKKIDEENVIERVQKWIDDFNCWSFRELPVK